MIGPGTAEKLPGLRQTLMRLGNTIDGDAMRAANKLVDFDGGTVADAALLLTERIRPR